jgi:hypothetical protein
MDTSDQVVYRDAFLGNIQRSVRALEPIRFPLVVTLNRPTNSHCWPALTQLLEAIYCDQGSINIVSQLENKLMIIFSDDHDATSAYQELQGRSIQDQFGNLMSFKIWHPVDDLGYDVADHQIYVSIEGLPLHLWKKDIVVLILHPYCTLEHISQETRERRNLSSYTTFAWSQQRIAMPRKISLKVTKKTPVHPFLNTA